MSWEFVGQLIVLTCVATLCAALLIGMFRPPGGKA